MISYGLVNSITDQSQRIRGLCWIHILIIAVVNGIFLIPLYLFSRNLSLLETYSEDEDRDDSQETIEVVIGSG
jgi:hypothetical protein